jgi:hypothetical protein
MNGSAWLVGALTLAIAGQADAAGRPPADAPKPRAVSDMDSALSQTSTIVEGTVTALHYDYNDRDGPWTTVMLSNVRAHAGSAPAQLQLRQFGGRTNRGTMVVASELPVFVQGKRYVVFLRNTSWNLSPVVGDFALRVERVNQAELLITADGEPVTGVGERGLTVGPVLFGPHELDGSPPKLLPLARAAALPPTVSPPRPTGGSGSATTVVAPAAAVVGLDRASFVTAVNLRARAIGVRVGGAFWDQPAGEFQWQGVATGEMSGAAARSAPSTFEPDRSGSR